MFSETSNFQENGSPKLVKSPSKSFSTKYSPHSPKIMVFKKSFT